MKYSVIDIGSNTIRLIIYNVEDGNVKKLLDKKNTAGLASYINDNTMNEKGIKKLIKVLKNLHSINQIIDIDHEYIFATAAIRNASNCKEILERVDKEVDVNIDLIEGKREAILGVSAIREEYKFKDGIIIDIGGGSSEITIIDNDEIIYEDSVPIGSLSAYRDYVKNLFVTQNEKKNIKKAVREQMEKMNIPKVKKSYSAYGIGGTIRLAGNMSSEIYDGKSSKLIVRKDLKDMINQLIDTDMEYVNTLLQVNASRIHTAIPGFIILNTIIKTLSIDEINISDKGIREGYLLSKIN